MPSRAENVPYEPFPTEQAGGGGGTPMSVRSTPENFGSQVSQAVEGAGKEGFDIAQKQQGMINETAMTKADAEFATNVGKIKAGYTSLTGQAAYDAFPKYQQDVQQAFQDSRANLPPAAQRGFDMMATRTMANHIADGSSYATSQLKEANRYAYSDMANANMQALADPDIASNPERSKYHIDSLKYAAQAQVDSEHPGLKTDKETGTVSFDESTPEGQHGKQQLQNLQDRYLAQGYLNKYTTLSNTVGAFTAYNEYQKERDQMPRTAQVALDASFAPKMFNAHVQTGTNTTLAQASEDHARMLYNPDTSKSAIDTVMANEGGKSPDGHAIYGIDKNAHPEEFAKASAMPEAEGKEYAKQFYKSEYWDKKGIGNLPPETQSIVMDGVVNHSTDFGNKLIQAAKDGASPQELIDMRRQEYSRLNDSGKPEYTENFKGWNNRLDNLQAGMAMEGRPKSYGTNTDGSPLTQADYFRTHSLDVYQRGDAYAEQQMPGDLALKRAVRQSLENYMNKTISNQSAQYMMDNKSVIRAINGEMTNGKPPQTEQELRSLPGMSALLDKVAIQDPKFSETIPGKVSAMARRNDKTNSPNAYSATLQMLDANDAASAEGHLHSLFGRTDGTGINAKDYNDAMKANNEDYKFKSWLSKNMKSVANSNGNIDGQGQNRALQFFNDALELKKTKEAAGVSVPAMLDPENKDYLGNISGNYTPARTQQISNTAQALRKQPSEFNYDTIKSGQQYTAPDGSLRTKR